MNKRSFNESFDSSSNISKKICLNQIMLSELPDDTIEIIFGFLPEKDWCNFALCSKSSSEIFNNSKNRLVKEIKTQEDFLKACKEGHIETLKSIQNINRFNLNLGLKYICQKGHLNLAKFLIKKGADNLKDGFGGACRNGNIKLIQYLYNIIEKNYNLYDKNHALDMGLQNASFAGNKQLCISLISRGANNYEFAHRDACKTNQRNIIDFLYSKVEDLDLSLYGACYGGHKNLVDEILEKGVKTLDYGLEGAVRGGQLEMTKYMIEKGGTDYYIQNSLLYEACHGGNKQVIQFLIQLGFNDLESGLSGAIIGRKKEIIIFIVNKIKNYYHISEIKEIIETAIEDIDNNRYRDEIDFLSCLF